MNTLHNSLRISMLTTMVTIALQLPAMPAFAADPVIHVTWEETPAPVIDADYEIVTSSPASVDFPDVKLLSGSETWKIWSVDTDNPGDVGDIGVVSCPAAADFVVKIERPDHFTPGAREIKGINLVPTSASNFSSVYDSLISGDFSGDLVVQKSSGDEGGEIAGLIIEGDAAGDITADTVLQLRIDGDATGAITLELIDIWGLLISGDLSGSLSVDIAAGSSGSDIGSVSGTLTIGTLVSSFRITGDVSGDIDVTTKIDKVDLTVQGSVTSTASITIADMQGDTVEFPGEIIIFPASFNVLEDFAGSLVLETGIPDLAVVIISGEFSSGGSIDASAGDLSGALFLEQSGGGTIDAGAVLDGGEPLGLSKVVLASGSGNSYSGTATFASVGSKSHIETDLDASLSGTLIITNSVDTEIDIDGYLASTGSIDIGGNLESTGLISIGTCAGGYHGDRKIRWRPRY